MQEIAEVEELSSLPLWSVVLDVDGYAWQLVKWNGRELWQQIGDDDDVGPQQRHKPFRVIHQPLGQGL